MNKFLILCLVVGIYCVSLDLEKIRNDILERHNLYRKRHQVGQLTREPEIEKLAQDHADKCALLGYIKLSSNTYKDQALGENSYQGYNNGYVGTASVDLWYNDSLSYDFSNPGYKEGVGHFTQIVWKNSKKIGCGIAVDDKETYYVTCHYYPAGNYLSQFAANVFPKLDGVEDDKIPTIDVHESEEKELEQFRNDALKRHNYYRALHKVDDLVRDSDLEKIAQKNVDYMIKSNSFHFTDEKYNGEYVGENLYSITGGNPDGATITDKWYDGINKYDFKKPGFASDAGGFTQIVWKNTKKIGCAYAFEGAKYYISCIYFPSGNYNTQFEANVFPKA